jgi:hypothetical protein
MRKLLALAAAGYLLYSLRGMRRSAVVPDDVLITKVRALSGPIAQAELAACVRAVRRIPGVRSITNRLRTHAAAA